MHSFGVDFARVGWGVEGGLLPNVCLGWVRLWCCRGSVFVSLDRARKALVAAVAELSK